MSLGGSIATAPFAVRAALGWLLLPVAALLALACTPERPPGELGKILPEAHAIANPGKLGASATGKACAVTQKEALTSAQRVAQFNLRSLTGQARYKVRFDLVDETVSDQGFCIEVTALAIPPLPFER